MANTGHDADINYFADKAVKRLCDFAVFGKSLPAEKRGETCLDQFKKNSNKEWAQKFYELNLGKLLIMTKSAGFIGLSLQGQKNF